jgi:vancomycin permeability regulator SanA
MLPEQAPKAPVAIVFGAGLRWNGTPTPVLYDRVATGVQLYQAGKVAQLLMSGSRFSEGYDEPAAMKELAISLGVPAEAILTDSGGTRTLTTCLRALTEFGIDQALLVSQSYHLPRALATCDGLGLSAVGVSADLRSYHPRALRFWETREIPATLVALVETRLVRKN